MPINHCPVVPREESYPRVLEKPWREGMKGRHGGTETPRDASSRSSGSQGIPLTVGSLFLVYLFIPP